jgi:hypothetical protein
MGPSESEVAYCTVQRDEKRRIGQLNSQDI